MERRGFMAASMGSLLAVAGWFVGSTVASTTITSPLLVLKVKERPHQPKAVKTSDGPLGLEYWTGPFSISLPEYVCPIHGDVGKDVMNLGLTGVQTGPTCSRCIIELIKKTCAHC